MILFNKSNQFVKFVICNILKEKTHHWWTDRCCLWIKTNPRVLDHSDHTQSTVWIKNNFLRTSTLTSFQNCVVLRPLQPHDIKGKICTNLFIIYILGSTYLLFHLYSKTSGLRVEMKEYSLRWYIINVVTTQLLRTEIREVKEPCSVVQQLNLRGPT